MKSQQDSGESSENAYLGFMGTSGNDDYYNYFLDRGSSGSSNYVNFTFTQSGTGYTIKYSITTGSGRQQTTTDYYMCAAYNSSSTTGNDITTSSELVDTKTIAINAFTSSNKTNDVWQLVTKKERDEYFAKSVLNGQADAGVTYYVKDYSFGRRDLEISNWKIADGNAMVNGRYNTEVKESTPSQASSASYTYYVGNGIAEGQNQVQSGSAWTANIHGASGKLYQSITVPAAGHYRVTCKGMTTSKGTATFYASSNGTTASQKFFNNDLNVTSATYIDGWTELQNDKYFSAVTIYVAKDGTLEFGVEVSGGEADSWACFDDFEIEYVDNGAYYVVLDENKTSVDYIDKQKDNESVKAYKVTAYIHRSFTAGVWNTIVLPFDVNKGSLISAFGAGTTISKFVGATDADNPHVLYFEPATSIEKDQLYLIIPTTSEPSGLAEVKGTVDTYSLTDKYYQLSGVTFTRDGSTPTTVSGDKGKEVYENDQTNLVFTGTYIKKENIIPAYSYLISAGTEDVEGSTGTWYYRTLPSSSRAFRGWLQPEEKKTANVESIVINGVTSDLETTAIEGLTIDTTSRLNGNIYNLSGQLVRANATSTEGLAKGLYIVNGKKIVVR